MKLTVASADVREIKAVSEYFPISGAATNPSYLSKDQRNPLERLREIRDYLGDQMELHVQVVAETAEGMLRDAERILSCLGENTYVKVPVTREGLKAIGILSRQGVRINATAIYTAAQGYLAGQAGAKYAAPYIGRIDNMGFNGTGVAKELHDIYRANHMDCGVFAASIKSTKQVLELAGYGIAACTLDPPVIEALIRLDAVDSAVKVFTRDFESICGIGNSMSDI